MHKEIYASGDNNRLTVYAITTYEVLPDIAVYAALTFGNFDSALLIHFVFF